jgi:hypothetical protein
MSLSNKKSGLLKIFDLDPAKAENCVRLGVQIFNYYNVEEEEIS